MSVTAPPTLLTAGTGQEFVFLGSLDAPGTVSLHREQLPEFALFGMGRWLAGATQPADVRPEQLGVPVAIRVVLDAARPFDQEWTARALELCRVTVSLGSLPHTPLRALRALSELEAAAEKAPTGDDGAGMRRAARRVAAQTPAVAVERPQMPALTGDPVADVRALYGLTYAQLASLLGVTERQVHRLDAERMTGARRERLDALVAVGLIVIGGLGPDGAYSWLEAGEPSGNELLRQGRYAELRARAESLRDSVAT